MPHVYTIRWYICLTRFTYHMYAYVHIYVYIYTHIYIYIYTYLYYTHIFTDVFSRKSTTVPVGTEVVGPCNCFYLLSLSLALGPIAHRCACCPSTRFQAGGESSNSRQPTVNIRHARQNLPRSRFLLTGSLASVTRTAYVRLVCGEGHAHLTRAGSKKSTSPSRSSL